MNITERHLQEIGSSLLVTLPKDWTRSLKLRKGSTVKIMVSEQGILSIAPEFTRPTDKLETMIAYDAHVKRRFIREYFRGNEKITILTKEGLSEGQSGTLHSFLKRFMNVQTIEESEKRVVVKCFKIEELSIEECLRRMYFLTVNLFDEIATSPDAKTISEIRDAITRFYYMLVMQVRRFLAEGKFTQENQIPLIRAMDLRMVAEKVRRIGNALIQIAESQKSKDPAGSAVVLVSHLKGPYTVAFESFVSGDFERSLDIWKGNQAAAKRFESAIAGMKKAMKNAMAPFLIEQIQVNVQEISRLSR